MFVSVNGLHMEPPSELQRKAVEQVSCPVQGLMRAVEAFVMLESLFGDV